MGNPNTQGGQESSEGGLVDPFDKVFDDAEIGGILKNIARESEQRAQGTLAATEADVAPQNKGQASGEVHDDWGDFADESEMSDEGADEGAEEELQDNVGLARRIHSMLLAESKRNPGQSDTNKGWRPEGEDTLAQRTLAKIYPSDIYPSDPLEEEMNPGKEPITTASLKRDWINALKEIDTISGNPLIPTVLARFCGTFSFRDLDDDTILSFKAKLPKTIEYLEGRLADKEITNIEREQYTSGLKAARQKLKTVEALEKQGGWIGVPFYEALISEGKGGDDELLATFLEESEILAHTASGNMDQYLHPRTGETDQHYEKRLSLFSSRERDPKKRSLISKENLEDIAEYLLKIDWKTRFNSIPGGESAHEKLEALRVKAIKDRIANIRTLQQPISADQIFERLSIVSLKAFYERYEEGKKDFQPLVTQEFLPPFYLLSPVEQEAFYALLEPAEKERYSGEAYNMLDDKISREQRNAYVEELKIVIYDKLKTFSKNGILDGSIEDLPLEAQIAIGVTYSENRDDTEAFLGRFPQLRYSPDFDVVLVLTGKGNFLELTQMKSRSAIVEKISKLCKFVKSKVEAKDSASELLQYALAHNPQEIDEYLKVNVENYGSLKEKFLY